MQQFIYKLFLVRPSIYMLHILQEKFKKFVFLASPKTRVVTASWELERDAKVLEESLEIRYNLVSLLCKTKLLHIFIFSNY